MRNQICLAARVTERAALFLALCSLLFVAACGAPDGGDSTTEAPAREVVRDPGVVTAGDWPVITGNLAGQRYSTLTQITADNFDSLGVAWSFDASEFPRLLCVRRYRAGDRTGWSGDMD